MKDERKREDFNDLTNNTYVIRRRLAELKVVKPNAYFRYNVGDFEVLIYTTGIYDGLPPDDDCITRHDKVDVVLSETTRCRKGGYSSVRLEQDPRFKGYQPIKYHELPGYSDGRKMPLEHLCELIKYLHKLTNLAAFA